jgi:hypothetical protein
MRERVRMDDGARVAAYVRWEQSGDGRRDCCSVTDGAVRQPGRRLLHLVSMKEGPGVKAHCQLADTFPVICRVSAVVSSA